VTGGSFDYPYYGFQIIGGNPIDVASYEFIRGTSYRFVDGGASNSGHPFFISDQGRLTASTFTITSTGTFSTGIPAGGSLQFQLPSTFTGTITYYCVVVSHSNMTNTFKTENATLSTTNLNERALD
jgi:hypothetical protein